MGNLIAKAITLLLFSFNISAQKDYVTHHSNGNIIVKGTIVNGKKRGLWEAYNSDKNLIIKRAIIISLSIENKKNNTIISFYFSELKEFLSKTNVKIHDKTITLEDYFHLRLFEPEITKESSITKKGIAKKRAKEINKLLLNTKIHYWFKNN